MPNIGFWAVAGAGGGGGDYELISTAYGTGSSNTITFSSIPSTYKHLQLRATIRGTDTTTNLQFKVQFNGSTTSLYSWHDLIGDGSGVSSTSGTSQTFIRLDNLAGASSVTGNHSALILDVLDYTNTTTNKTTRALSGNANSLNYVRLTSGNWRSTAAVTSLSIAANAAAISTTSRFSLYGIRG